MKLSSSACLLMLMLAACATTVGYEKKMNEWIGRPADDLYAKLGTPSSLSPLGDGGKVIQYDRTRVVELTREHTELVPEKRVERQSESDGKTVFGPTSNYSKSSETVETAKTVPAKTYTRSCSTRYRVNAEGIIQSVSWEGNDCRARE